MQKSTWSSCVGYLFLCIPATGGAWFHWKIFPLFVKGLEKYLREGAMPTALQWAWEHDFLMYGFPVLLIILACISIRVEWLREKWLIGLLGAALASYYLFYGFALCSPLLSQAPIF